jgi:hypothetical protein
MFKQLLAATVLAAALTMPIAPAEAHWGYHRHYHHHYYYRHWH